MNYWSMKCGIYDRLNTQIVYMYKELFGIRHVWMISQTQHLHHLVSEQYEWKFYEIGFILKSENK